MHLTTKEEHRPLVNDLLNNKKLLYIAAQTGIAFGTLAPILISGWSFDSKYIAEFVSGGPVFTAFAYLISKAIRDYVANMVDNNGYLVFASPTDVQIIEVRASDPSVISVAKCEDLLQMTAKH